MKNRLEAINKKLKEKNLDAVIITNPFNIFYLTGFKGVSPTEREAILIVNPTNATLITARLYQIEAKNLESSKLKIKIANERNEINEFIKDSLAKVKNVGFEEHNLKFSEFIQFKKLLKAPPAGGKLTPTGHLIEDLRVIKTADEIKNIERAQIISQKALELVLKTLKIGQTEVEIAEKLASIIKSLGAGGLAFETIVASGQNSAKPHHITGHRRLTKNDTLLFDFGAKYQDYCADLSRTIFIGRALGEQAKFYHHVAKAQQKAIAKIKSGARASSAHKTALSHFKKHKLDESFTHSLGHGIGLEVHEKPSLSAKSKDVFREGMVFSVEPGLYFPAWGGIRIEDLVAIKNNKAQIIGKSAQFTQLALKA